MKKLFAFSLAEVLVALSIIGIVGALTLPNVRKTYQQKEAHSRATKVQHVLDTATVALLRDKDSFENIVRGKSDDAERSLAVLTAYSQYMKFTNVCGKTILSTACFPTSTIADPLNLSTKISYNYTCETKNGTSFCSNKQESADYFTPMYPDCNVNYMDYSSNAKCTISTSPGSSSSNCATAILNDGTAIAFCSKASAQEACKANNNEFCPAVAVYYDIKGPKNLASLAVSRNVFFGFLGDEGFVDAYKTISSISNGSFSE